MASKKKADESNQQKSRQPRKDSKPRSSRVEREREVDGGDAPDEAAPRATERTAERSGPTGKVVVEREIGGRTLSIETGRMAKLSDGACVVRYGDTMVLATVNSGKAPDNIDFFPLTVDYREKTSAAGVIPGGFFKREGRPTTKEILASRLIDRSIRPMFPDGFRREVQVLSQVLSTDRENDPDVIAAIASFAALALSSLPHGQSLGMVRIGQVDGKLVVNPLWSAIQSDANKLNLTLAGHADAIMMVEAGAKEVSEETMIEALELAHGVVREIAGMIDEIVAKAGKQKIAFTPPKKDEALIEAIESEFGEDLRKAPLVPGNKQTRSAATKAVKEKAAARFHAPSGASESEAKGWNMKVAEILSDIAKDAERQSILRGKRADGRDTKSIRPISIEVSVLPRVHGSALFTRGETQALGVVTLGGTDDQQIIDGLMPEPRKRFLLHYSFPPFSVGEVKRVLAPGRREIGHGALAERGLEALLPTREEFPYTIRITSEILESNGSSSMATVCAGTLAMMDAGVAIKQPVAGIAMGLVMEGKRYAILSDILGSEDACGDMDFKVVGTGRGITALQMDIKCDGLTRAIMAEALEQAKQGRLHILREMLKALRAPRKELSPNAPRLESVQVPSGKIGMIIGPGGKNIRAMQEQFEVKISIEDSGLCTITGLNAEKVKGAVDHVKAMTAEVELGSVYEGRVTAIKEFGAFVEILPGQEGLVHVSELSDEFIRAVTDVVRIGDTLKVKVIAIDDFGKIKLSRKALLAAERGGAPAASPAGPGAEPAAPEAAAMPPRGDRPERSDRPERGERHERGDRGPRPDRFDRGERPERGEFRDRPERGDRSERPQHEHGERGPRGDRPERSFGGRDESRGARPEWSGRGERDGGRPEGGPRPPREERSPGFEGRDRDERRPPREERSFGGDRPQRPARGDEGAEFSRGPRTPRDADVGDRGPRPPRDADMGDRGPRPPRDASAGDRGPRAPRDADGGDRGTRRDGGRDERWGRHDAPRHGGDERRERRPDPREPREARPVTEDRPRGGDGGGFVRDRGERPDRPERSDRGDRIERPDRGDRGPRPERTDRPQRPERPDRGDRIERPDRGDGERADRGGGQRAGRTNMPMREFGDDDTFERPAAAKPPTPEVGKLEPIDDVLGDDGPRERGPRRRGGRRH